MKLTRDDFLERYEKGNLNIALVGMSNIGKSYTAKRLAENYNFNLIEIDKLIQLDMGHKSLVDFAEWQGQPFSKGYAEREGRSIQLETLATKKAILSKKNNTLIDTTGSVIYIDNTVLKKLTENFFIVYIQVHNDHLKNLTSQYLSNPKPLIWKNFYRKIPGKTHIESLMLCYPELLNARKKEYEKISDKIISSAKVLNRITSIDDIYKLLQPSN